ncbi:MAG: FKBP-type peptidyl-prolyl cis-trans isomerase [Gammaproteobacteria bacterium]|nr:FKBP-type peptidyl-prolyl cis-trans isomerase [Gammaproteobacteria bacterium]NVK86618.1 FKBP-type peptidyl-prolyl cis-trans isomerase [Gammaproteobacteria bacterium]
MSSMRLANDEMLKKMNIDKALLAKGFSDGLNGQSEFDEQQIQEQLMAFQGAIQAKMQEEQSAKVQPVKDEGSAHVAQLKQADESIKTTESGLHYKVISEGEGGDKPAATDTVKVHYTGTLIDGTKFDSSVDRGEPTTFPLNRVIAGWTEGLQLMSVGDKYRFYIPSDLGYGDQGYPPNIPGGATLIFDVELLDIQNVEKAAEKASEAEAK